MIVSTEWFPLAPRRFTDKRARLTRESGIVYQNVRAFHGALVRRNPETGKPEYDQCGHAHNKMGAAKACAVREAKRRNRAAKKGN
jgi:hypothetical protein